MEMPIAHTNIKCASWECQSTTATHIVAVENIKCTSLAFAPPWISCNSCSGQLACLISLYPSEHVNLRPSCGGNNRYRGKSWCFPRECFTSHWQSFKGRFAQHNYEKSKQEYENSSKTLTPTLLLGRHTLQKQTEAKCIQETSRPVAPSIWAIS